MKYVVISILINALFLQGAIAADGVDLEKKLRLAINQNNPEEVRILLSNPDLDPAKDKNRALHLAADLLDPQILKMVLLDERFKPMPRDREALIKACRIGRVDTAIELLKDPRFGAGVKNEAFIMAAEKGRLPIIAHMLLNEEISFETKKIALSLAIKGQFFEMRDLLLREDENLKIEDVEDLGRSLRLAIIQGNIEKVRELLKHPKLDPAKDGNAALHVAADHKNPKILAMILENEKFKPLPRDREALIGMCKTRYFDLIKMLLEDKNRFDADAKEEAFKVAAKKGDPKIIEYMLSNETIGFEARKYALFVAIENHFVIVATRLLEDKNLAFKLDSCLIKASKLGNCPMVQFLLERLNSMAEDYRYAAIYNALQATVKNGHVQIVALLLNVAPKRRDVIELAIKNAQEYYYDELAQSLSKILATLPPVNTDIAPKDDDSEMLEEIIEDEQPVPVLNDDERFFIAARDGKVEVLRQLLGDYRLDPAYNDNAAFRVAASNGQAEIVKVLSADGRVNPTALNNEALRMAARNGHVETVRVLLENPSIDAGANNNEAIRMAQKNEHSDVVELLRANLKVNPAVLDDMMAD